MQIALAPMKGLVDEILHDVLTRVGGIDWCITEFICITDHLLPATASYKPAPGLCDGSRTRAGTPMRVQLLSSDPACLADNAALVYEPGASIIDLSFGRPAKTANRSRGDAVLLKGPELMHGIVAAVRRAVPNEIVVISKMRLGYDSPDGALDCTRALADGGSAHVVMHARTKVDGYRPSAHWERVARVAEAMRVPVFASGEVWVLDDYLRCREISGVEDTMFDRGLVSRPGLIRQIATWHDGGEIREMPWNELLPLLRNFWLQARCKLAPRYAPGRLKQWLGMLMRTYPETVELFARIRRGSDCETIDRLLQVSFSQAA